MRALVLRVDLHRAPGPRDGCRARGVARQALRRPSRQPAEARALLVQPVLPVGDIVDVEARDQRTVVQRHGQLRRAGLQVLAERPDVALHARAVQRHELVARGHERVGAEQGAEMRERSAERGAGPLGRQLRPEPCDEDVAPPWPIGRAQRQRHQQRRALRLRPEAGHRRPVDRPRVQSAQQPEPGRAGRRGVRRRHAWVSDERGGLAGRHGGEHGETGVAGCAATIGGRTARRKGAERTSVRPAARRARLPLPVGSRRGPRAGMHRSRHGTPGSRIARGSRAARASGAPRRSHGRGRRCDPEVGTNAIEGRRS